MFESLQLWRCWTQSELWLRYTYMQLPICQQRAFMCLMIGLFSCRLHAKKFRRKKVCIYIIFFLILSTLQIKPTNQPAKVFFVKWIFRLIWKCEISHLFVKSFTKFYWIPHTLCKKSFMKFQNNRMVRILQNLTWNFREIWLYFLRIVPMSTFKDLQYMKLAFFNSFHS